MAKACAKRAYNSNLRRQRAQETRERVLGAGKKLFEAKGIEGVTIEEIAKEAEVSGPTVYALFRSKDGLLRALVDESLPADEFEALVRSGAMEQCPVKRLRLTATLARKLYDAECVRLKFMPSSSRGYSAFHAIEAEQEKRRYQRQQVFVEILHRDGVLMAGLEVESARGIFWALTGRDLYRMLVMDRGWAPDRYEKWLGDLLIASLLDQKIVAEK